MRIYAGIDEAGYGPLFGPLVIGRSVFRVEDGGEEGAATPPPSIRSRLRAAVCRRPTDRRRRIPVDDSKALYSPAEGLGHLERAVLAFAHLAGVDPTTADELLDAIALDEGSRTPPELWYAAEHGEPALPVAADPSLTSIARGQLGRAAVANGVALSELSAAVLFEDRFNRVVRQTRSKARCLWDFVARHLWEIWQAHGDCSPWVVVDRQGGRKVYHELLELCFEGRDVRLLDESADVSRYRIEDGRRQMTVSFEADSESRHVPTAVASMTAKYLRELLMQRLNRFFRAERPALRPTAGYAADGKRFLREVTPVLERLGLPRTRLERIR